ncbi:hypothetical protein [Ilumatobacter sp.]|uniref:hypothetical protein n=1 Tax=Ilumatobacter sp. TaxID=1967498 RepID=UPI003B51EC3E
MDLDAVDELCRAALAARRLGCRVALVDPDPALLDLLRLTGAADVFDIGPDRDPPDPAPTLDPPHPAPTLDAANRNLR